MCPGAAQYMFRGASSFNQPLAAWDVSQVTSMKVRRQGHNHRAPPHTAAQGSGHKPCACAGAAQDMFYSASSFNQPLAAWDVGQVKAMSVRRRPASTGWGLLLHTQLLRSVHKPCACAGAAQYMFESVPNQASPLSGCNQLLIHTSFEAQVPSVWGYDDWTSAWCNTPLSPPSPPLPPFQPGTAFSDKGNLQSAIYEWIADAEAATAQYSHISFWDVSAVTDMDELLAITENRYGSYSYMSFGDAAGGWDRDTNAFVGFDEDINAWDVSRVTTMEVSHHRLPPRW